MKNTKKNAHIKHIALATGKMIDFQKKYQYLPGAVLINCEADFDLTFDECEVIREVVQSDAMKSLWEQINEN